MRGSHVEMYLYGNLHIYFIRFFGIKHEQSFIVEHHRLKWTKKNIEKIKNTIQKSKIRPCQGRRESQFKTDSH